MRPFIFLSVCVVQAGCILNPHLSDGREMDAWEKTSYPLPQPPKSNPVSDGRKGGLYGLAFAGLLIAVPVLLAGFVVLDFTGFAVAS